MKIAVTTLGICVAILTVLGLVMLYSVSMVMLDKTPDHALIGSKMLVNQVAWFAVSLVACVVMGALDYSQLRKLAWPLFIGSIVLAGLVFIPHIGMAINGAHRWIRMPGGRSFQPSEMVKLGIIVIVAWYAENSARKMQKFLRGALLPFALVGAALAVVFIEPDRGTCILMLAVTCLMLLMGGARWTHLILLGALAAALVGASIYVKHNGKHDEMRQNRITNWLNGTDPQQTEAAKAFGRGGIVGAGLGGGLQKNGYLAEIHSDFIFANVGEELGLAATFSVLLLYFLIAVCGLEIARQASDQFGCLLAIGVTVLITGQAIFNMCVVTSVVPNKGIALPFVSAGGSSLLAMFIGVGILTSVARRANPLKAMAHDFPTDTNPFAARAT